MSKPSYEINPEEDVDVKTKEPKMHKVILLNDDYTPMDFVVSVLMQIFQKTETQAHQITMDIHHKGKGICGVYTADIAETKVQAVLNQSELNNHPLEATSEED